MEIALPCFFPATAENRRDAQAAMPDRTGQRHVKQAQILRQTLRFRQLNAGFRLAEIEHRIESLAVMIIGLILNAVVGDKGQPDQRILETFRFVNGDDLHQMLIALKTHLLA